MKKNLKSFLNSCLKNKNFYKIANFTSTNFPNLRAVRIEYILTFITNSMSGQLTTC